MTVALACTKIKQEQITLHGKEPTWFWRPSGWLDQPITVIHPWKVVICIWLRSTDLCSISCFPHWYFYLSWSACFNF